MPLFCKVCNNTAFHYCQSVMGTPAWVSGFSGDVPCAVIIACMAILSTSQPRTASLCLQKSSYFGPYICFDHHCYDSSWNGDFFCLPAMTAKHNSLLKTFAYTLGKGEKLHSLSAYWSHHCNYFLHGRKARSWPDGKADTVCAES